MEGITKDRIQEILSRFNDDDVEKVNYFYRIILDFKSTLRDLPLSIEITDIVTDTLLKKVKKNNNPYYKLIIDYYMLTALECDSYKDIENAKKYFNKAIEFGEKYSKESKERYYDELNCAYTWIGYYLYQDKDYKNALKCFEKVMDKYNSVKDDPNYSVTEKDSVPNSISYIENIKSILKK